MTGVSSSVIQFLKNWTLPISMVMGVIGYFFIDALPLDETAQASVYDIISHHIQPVLLFCMLFLSFTKVDPHDMQPHRWQWWVLLCQTSMFILFSLLAVHVSGYGEKILLEGAMLCFICPTATASAVITGKLGGSVSGVTTYLLLCNLMVALLGPVFLTMVEPRPELTFVTSFFMIMGKVFPLLICPLVLAWLVRFIMPKVHQWLLGKTGMAFYLWSVALALAILVTVRSIMNTTVGMYYLLGLALISLVACVFQFAVGKKIGTYYDSLPSTGDAERPRKNRITAGQAFGQKNTVFVIWLGLVFLDPVTSVVGGLYSIWHNIINSYQLYKVRKAPSNSPTVEDREGK